MKNITTYLQRPSFCGLLLAGALAASCGGASKEEVKEKDDKIKEQDGKIDKMKLMWRLNNATEEGKIDTTLSNPSIVITWQAEGPGSSLKGKKLVITFDGKDYEIEINEDDGLAAKLSGFSYAEFVSFKNSGTTLSDALRTKWNSKDDEAKKFYKAPQEALTVKVDGKEATWWKL